MSSHPEPDPDELLAALQRGAGGAPLPPLTLASPSRSARGGPLGRLVDAVRTRVLAPVPPMLIDLVDQLERDRQRLRADVERQSRRIDELERRLAGEPPPG